MCCQHFLNDSLMPRKAQRWPEEAAYSWPQSSLPSEHTLVLSLGLDPTQEPDTPQQKYAQSPTGTTRLSNP